MGKPDYVEPSMASGIICDFLLKMAWRKQQILLHKRTMLTSSAQLRSTGQDGTAIMEELKRFTSDTQWQDRLLNYAQQYAVRIIHTTMIS